MAKLFVDVWHVDEKPLDVAEGLAYVTGKPNGAEALFVGTIRSRNQGKEVLGVSYDVFESLAKCSFKAICMEAQERWGEINLYVTHAKGRLPVSGIGIVIAVGSPHHDEAFNACRYILKAIKQRSPIWKLEHYAEGDSEWIQGCTLCDLSDDADEG